MADPFKPPSSQQLIREAKLGLSIVALLFATLIYVGTLRITGQTPMFPFNQMVGFQNTDTLRPSSIETMADSETNNSGKTFHKGKEIYKSTEEVVGKNIEPHRENQFFSKKSTMAAIGSSTIPSSQIKNQFTSRPINSNDVPKANRKNNTGMFVPPKTKAPVINPAVPQIKPKTPSSAGNVFNAQFESNIPQLENPREPSPVTPTPSKNSSFLNPSQPITQQAASTHCPPTEALSQSRPFPIPIQFENALPSIPNDETSKQKISNRSTHSVIGLKTPSNFLPPDLKPTIQLHPAEAPKISQIYNTKPGDTYWSVSAEIYKDGRYFRALFRHNQAIHTDYELVSGLVLKTPAKHELERRWPNECPTTSEANISVNNENSVGTIAYHVTSNEETLFEIARQKLNQGSRFVELYQLNPNSLSADTQPDAPLPNGLKLLLPK